MKVNKREEEKIQKPFNVVLLGNIESEKAALIHKLIKKRFAINQLKKMNQSVDSINEKSNINDLMNSVEIHGETVKMKIYDNTSANKVFSYSNKSLSSAQGIILFYNVNDRNSFNILKSNLHKIMSMNKYDFPMVMVGNESDSPIREVNYEEAKALADSYGLSFYEVSINSGYGIGPMFEDLGEQVVYKEYGNNFCKKNKSMINNRTYGNLNEKENLISQKKKKNISIYENEDLYDNEFNKGIKEKLKHSCLNSSSFVLSHNKNKLRTNYKTFTNESEDSISNSLRNNKNGVKSKNNFIIKSPELFSNSVILSYRGSTEAQKKREEEIRAKRLEVENEMKTWWKIREKENLEMQKLKKLKYKKVLKERIKADKIIQKEKEKKIQEECLKKVKLNYQQKKQNNKIAEKELILKKENLRKEKLQDKISTREKLNKLKEEKEIEEKEKEREKEKEKEKILVKQKKIVINIDKIKDFPNRNDKKNSNLSYRSKTEKIRIIKNKKENNNLSNNNSCILKESKEEQKINNNMKLSHAYEKKSELIENYKNNSNIFRCLKCKLIPDILINESRQEIDIFCDHSYKDNMHYNITTYPNFIEQSLNHPIDNNNTFCIYCQKYANELSDDKNIFFCQKCDIYFCSDDEEIHKNLMHNNQNNIKEKYLNISKTKIKSKNTNKKNDSKMMTPTRSKFNKVLFKQNTTPSLSKKTNNKIIIKKQNSNERNKNEKNSNTKSNTNNTNNIKNKNYKLPFYLIDSHCGYHEDIFKFYCFDCHTNLCDICHKTHINHSLINFDDILLSDEELNKKKIELNKAKDDLVKLNDYFSALIEAIKCKFERLFNIKKKELEIKEKIIQDYETIKYNYHSINNIRNIKFNDKNNFMELSPNTDWFNRFNLIFKYLNSNLINNNYDIFDLLNSNSEKNNTKIISKNNDKNKINKLILLKNEDITALFENGNVKIFDKDKLEEKLNIKISDKNNFYINDIIQKAGGGLLCSGYEYIKFINLGIDNQYYNFYCEIQDSGSNINSVLEFNNNIIISLNDYCKLKLWKKNYIKNGGCYYKCINQYDFGKQENIKDEESHIIKIKYNSFVLSSKKESCLYKFVINKNENIELVSKLNKICLTQGNNIIHIQNENYLFASCVGYILLIDKNEFNIKQIFHHNYNFIDIYNYSDDYFIALDSNNNIYKIEFDKYQQKVFFEDNINLNINLPDCEKNISNIIFNNNKDKIILQMEDKFIKISDSD